MGKVYHSIDFLKVTSQLNFGCHDAAETNSVNAKTASNCSEHLRTGNLRDFRNKLLGDAVKARRILKDDECHPYHKATTYKKPFQRRLRPDFAGDSAAEEHTYCKMGSGLRSIV